MPSTMLLLPSKSSSKNLNKNNSNQIRGIMHLNNSNTNMERKRDSTRDGQRHQRSADSGTNGQQTAAATNSRQRHQRSADSGTNGQQTVMCSIIARTMLGTAQEPKASTRTK